MPSAHRQSLIARKQAMNRTLQSANAEKIEPGHRCIQFDVANSDETCWALWDEWEQVCNFDNWDDDCEAVFDEFYAQDLDWNMPEPIDTECMTHWDNMGPVCEAQVERMWNQCEGEEEYEGQPWKWTEACDALEMLDEGFSAFEHYDQCGDDSDCEVDSEDEDEY